LAPRSPHKKHGRLVVNIQADGDLMYAPGVLWTAAHHKIPLLSVMHNNRAYHQEVMHIQRMAVRHAARSGHRHDRHDDHRAEHRLRPGWRAASAWHAEGPHHGPAASSLGQSSALSKW